MDKLTEKILFINLFLIIAIATLSQQGITGFITGDTNNYDIEIICSETIDYSQNLIIGIEVTESGKALSENMFCNK